MLYNKTELNKLAKELGFVRDTFDCNSFYV